VCQFAKLTQPPVNVRVKINLTEHYIFQEKEFSPQIAQIKAVIPIQNEIDA
jgi:hypothetical protein